MRTTPWAPLPGSVIARRSRRLSPLHSSSPAHIAYYDGEEMLGVRAREATRATRQHPRSASLDALRGTAALLVLIGHAARLTTTPSKAGWLANGVMLFFPLSGFLIAGPFVRSLVDGRPLPNVPGY